MKMDNMTAWELFQTITSAYFGKEYYFLQGDGTVYSRLSCTYISKDDALKEFINHIALK